MQGDKHKGAVLRSDAPAPSSAGTATPSAAIAPPHAVPRKAQKLDLDPAMPAREACLAICREVIQQAQDNAAVVLDGRNPEGVHQMRVALRRFRAALKVFRPVLADAWEPRLVEPTRVVARGLGPAREWDVFLIEILPPVEQAFTGHDAVAALRRTAEAQQAAAYKTARQRVSGPAFSRLMKRSAVAFDWDEPAALVAEAQLSVADLAEKVLVKRHKAVVKRGKNFAALGEAERHRVRLAAKALRYSVEFFAPLYDKRAIKPYLGAVKALQEELGALNDVATLADQAAYVAKLRQTGRDALMGMGMVMGWYVRERTDREPRLLEAWERFRGAPPPWK